MTTVEQPVVARHGATDPEAPLVVLLQGRGSSETGIISLAGWLSELTVREGSAT